MSAPKYVPPHRRAHLRQQQRKPDQQYQKQFKKSERDLKQRHQEGVLFFGDSFIGLFKILGEHYPACVSVMKFKGAAAKGIGRQGNANRSKIIDAIVRKTNNKTDKTNIVNNQRTKLVFCFGSVDVHLSYYYKKVNKDGDVFILSEIAESYLAFINTLTSYIPANNITIVGIYPSPLQTDEDVRSSLCNYGSVQEDQLHFLDPDDDLSIAARQRRVRQYNMYLQRLCQQYGFYYDDVVDEMLDSTTYQIKPSFRDVSDRNIHVIWETTLLLWQERWPWLKKLIEESDIENILQHKLDKYLESKSWAERTHLASTLGVHGALEHDLTKRA